ncbi:MAG: hypothetical protein B7Z15_23885 [Rhizobiales bacterium 32-66-8]|nr:MAG: hypothetical protein B7Z15_23885 [Rhizobiales bacterium 32-66-8]
MGQSELQAGLDLRGNVTLHEIDPDVRAALAGLEVAEITGDQGQAVGRLRKIKLADKTANLTLLMRHLGMFNDKVKVQGDADNPLAMLIREVQGSCLKPVATPMLEHDDCARPVQ